MRDLTFANPHFSLILPFIFFILALQLALYRYRKTQIQLFTSEKLLPALLIPRSTIQTGLKITGLAFIWFFAVMALMGPRGNLRYSPSANHEIIEKQAETFEILFLIDTSASMNVPDGKNGQTRLNQAKEIMDDVVSQQKGMTIAIDAMTSELTHVVPPTQDYLFVRLMIQQLAINEGDVGGTRFEPVLEKVVDQLHSNPTTYGGVIFLFSDGGDNNVFETDTPSLKSIQMILKTIEGLDLARFKLYTIGIGNSVSTEIPNVIHDGQPVKSKLEPLILQKLASKGQGSYFNASEWNNWQLAAQLVQLANQDRKDQKSMSVEQNLSTVSEREKRYDLYFQIPLGFAILILFLGLFVFSERTP